MKDDLIYEPLATTEEIKSCLTDAKALQEGKITGLVGSPFWQRVTAEMTRRHEPAQLRSANSLKWATWLLVVATFMMVVATTLPLIARCQ